MVTKTKIGIIGCGNISDAYFKGCASFPFLEIVGCADIDKDRAQDKAEQYRVKAFTVEGLLASPDVDIIINLTIPAAHAEVSLAILEAGKHAYTEKPLALTRADGQKILALAQAKGLRVGAAPDTFLGGGLQTCRKLIDDGWIGTPVAANAFMQGHGPEAWHPNPDFFYKVGAGPLFDMGPYYLTALIHLLGPVKRVTASARISQPVRIATSPTTMGQEIQVEVPTHVAGVMDFHSGPIATLITSFDVWAHNLPRIEIYGTEGSLSVPDPNTFDGVIKVKRAGAQDWQEIPHTHRDDVSRGIGVADMALAIQSGRAHRANGELAYHVLDLMHAFYDASDRGQHVQVESHCERPSALPMGLLAGQLDE